MRGYNLKQRGVALRLAILLGSLIAGLVLATPMQAQSQDFRRAVAAAAADDADLTRFYKAREYQGIWSRRADRRRRDAVLAALRAAPSHGLPAARYEVDRLELRLRSARSPEAEARAEVALTRTFLRYARDLQTGVLTPEDVDPAIQRRVPLRNPLSTLTAFAASEPEGFLRALAPAAPEYARLRAEKQRLQTVITDGGWGPRVSARRLEEGDRGNRVLALRNRLRAMGYLSGRQTPIYDAETASAVRQFQEAHGLGPDGTAGPLTLAALNTSPARRLQSVIVAMERERWINRPRGQRHIWVNITDFTAQIVDKGEVTFATRSVVGARDEDRETPEFSDVMEFMVINPSWYVPESIVLKEYFPLLKEDPMAADNLVITNAEGEEVDRTTADFSGYTEEDFPYFLREPPSQGNALGLVKFMFPNRHNIYLHDTPQKRLFWEEVRAFSHGCIRLANPFEFAYALLAPQFDDPKAVFQAHLESEKERQVDLDQPVPVHLVYRTAIGQADGPMQYRADVYGRDGRIWEALAREGVVLPAVRG